ncbi:MAG TPA: MBL fold metallo-hydrolase, partial [Hyphomonadaceae bacterium]
MQLVPMKFHFIGSGDAFGTGGRFNTCFRVEHSGGAFLIDCGASSMVAIRKEGIDPNSIDAIFITHLHGDHFAGLPFFLLDAQLYSKRTKRLTIAGPYGLEERLMQAQEVLFPGSSETKLKFEVELIEIALGERRNVHGVRVEAYPMRHPCGAPPLGLRVSVDGRTVAYTGDTEWNEDIIPL